MILLLSHTVLREVVTYLMFWWRFEVLRTPPHLFFFFHILSCLDFSLPLYSSFPFPISLPFSLSPPLSSSRIVFFILYSLPFIFPFHISLLSYSIYLSHTIITIYSLTLSFFFSSLPSPSFSIPFITFFIQSIFSLLLFFTSCIFSSSPSSSSFYFSSFPHPSSIHIFFSFLIFCCTFPSTPKAA